MVSNGFAQRGLRSTDGATVPSGAGVSPQQVMHATRVERRAQLRVVGVGAPAGDPGEVLGHRQLGHVRDEPRREREFAERAAGRRAPRRAGRAPSRAFASRGSSAPRRSASACCTRAGSSGRSAGSAMRRTLRADVVASSSRMSSCGPTASRKASRPARARSTAGSRRAGRSAGACPAAACKRGTRAPGRRAPCDRVVAAPWARRRSRARRARRVPRVRPRAPRVRRRPARPCPPTRAARPAPCAEPR